MHSESRTKVIEEGPVFEMQVPDAGEHRTFDVCVLRFDDAARAVNTNQLEHVKKRIELARKGEDKFEKGGALVVAFIHGWHHDHAAGLIAARSAPRGDLGLSAQRSRSADRSATHRK